MRLLDMNMQIISPWPKPLSNLASIHRTHKPIFRTDFWNGVMDTLAMALELVLGREAANTALFRAFERLYVSSVVASGRCDVISRGEKELVDEDVLPGFDRRS